RARARGADRAASAHAAQGAAHGDEPRPFACADRPRARHIDQHRAQSPVQGPVLLPPTHGAPECEACAAVKTADGFPPEPQVSEEAARWVCTPREGDPAQRAAFFSWLRRSPQHIEEFLFATAV